MQVKDKKKSKKKPKNFEERFEGKKNAVGKGGLYDILDVYHPLSIQQQAGIKKYLQPEQQLQNKIVRKKRLSLTQKQQQINQKEKLRSNRTQIAKRPSIDSQQMLKLPKIGKTSSEKNIVKSSFENIDQEDADYWNLNKNRSKKRSGSQFSFRSLMRADYYAVSQFDILQKFQKKLKIAKKAKLN